MILRFGVENYRSFRDYTEVSFVSTARQDEPRWRPPAREAPHGVLPVLGVWGANASGKSNLLRALLDLRAHVAYSFSGREPGQPLPWTPWQMRVEPRHEPSMPQEVQRDLFGGVASAATTTRMDLDLLVDGIRHHFGFRFRDDGFVEEWLFAWPGGHKQVLFHRNHASDEPWYFGPNFRGARRHIVTATRPDSLFLSAAAQYNHAQLSPVFRAITRRIQQESPVEMSGYPLFVEQSPLLNPRFRGVLLRFLAAADLGVVNIKTREHKPPVTPAFPPAKVFTDEFLSQLRTLPKDPVRRELVLVHAGEDGQHWELDPVFESRGTSILLARLNDFFALFETGGLLVVDELESSLHPDLCGALLDLFTTDQTNPKGAQLLFTSHERSLMERLRTDEVLLADKGRDGASHVRAASDYKDLRARDGLRRAYEQGRIRGVPVLGDFARAAAEELHHGA